MENNVLVTTLVAPAFALVSRPCLRYSSRPGMRSKGMIRNAPCIIQEKGMKSSAFSRGFESTRKRFHTA